MTSVPQTSTARIDEDEEGPSLNQVCLDSDIKESNALLDDKDAVIKDLEEKLKQKSDECEYLSQQLKLEKFGIYRFSRDNTMINLYTGFQTYDTFLAFYFQVLYFFTFNFFSSEGVPCLCLKRFSNIFWQCF